MSDLIDRQEAIDALAKVAGVGNRALDAIRALPTAEPEYDMIYRQKELTDDDIEELKRQMKTWEISLLTAEPTSNTCKEDG